MAIDPVRDVAVWRWDLSDDAFGASPPQEDPDGDGQVFRLDLRFPGQRFDAASGLYHNYFRDYDPTVGRYVQSDPIGLLGGMSTYGYANQSPATFSDPMGLFGKKIGGGIANMLVRPIVQRLGGGVAARAASAAAHARAQARRAAEMAQRMQTVLGRILKGRSRKGGEPAGGAEIIGSRPALVEGAASLAGANRAIIDPRKLTEYALNPEHPIGGNKARVFESALGFNQNNATALLAQLRNGVMNNTPILGRVDQFGARYTVDMAVVGPAGTGVVRTGWIYRGDSMIPELTTLFVK